MNNQTSTPQNSRSNLPGWDLKDLYSGIDDPQIKKDLEESLEDYFKRVTGGEGIA